MYFIALNFLFIVSSICYAQSPLIQKNRALDQDVKLCVNDGGVEVCPIEIDGATGKFKGTDGDASATNSGLVSTGAQAFSGDKNFINGVTIGTDNNASAPLNIRTGNSSVLIRQGSAAFWKASKVLDSGSSAKTIEIGRITGTPTSSSTLMIHARITSASVGSTGGGSVRDYFWNLRETTYITPTNTVAYTDGFSGSVAVTGTDWTSSGIAKFVTAANTVYFIEVTVADRQALLDIHTEFGGE